MKGALNYYFLYHSETSEAQLSYKLGQYIVKNIYLLGDINTLTVDKI